MNFSVGHMENLAIKARQFPSLFIEMKDNVEEVLQELDELMNSTLSQTYPRFVCLHCKTIHKTRAAALDHAQEHFTNTTRPQNTPANLIRDFSFTLYSCSKCPGSFTTRANLVTHMHTHTLRKLWTCSICSYTSHYHCQIKEHILRTHSHNTNIFCRECPLHTAPYFKNALEYLQHLDESHDNELAKRLAETLMNPPEPVNPEVFMSYSI